MLILAIAAVLLPAVSASAITTTGMYVCAPPGTPSRSFPTSTLQEVVDTMSTRIKNLPRIRLANGGRDYIVWKDFDNVELFPEETQLLDAPLFYQKGAKGAETYRVVFKASEKRLVGLVGAVILVERDERLTEAGPGGTDGDGKM